ncbi:unnamed protein product [Arctogadus glacialis]
MWGQLMCLKYVTIYILTFTQLTVKTCMPFYWTLPISPTLCSYFSNQAAAFFEESSPIWIAFNSLYLLKYFGMVTTEQKEGKCVEHVLSDSQLIKTLTRQSELPRVSDLQPLSRLIRSSGRGLCEVGVSYVTY